MKNKPGHLMPRFEGQVLRGNPNGMEKIIIKTEERVLFERQALDIFTECSNSGLSLRDTLVALLITGMDWGVNASRSKKPHLKFNPNSKQ